MTGRLPPPLIALALGASIAFYGLHLVGFTDDGERLRSEAWTVIAAAVTAGACTTSIERRSARLLGGRCARSCRVAARSVAALGVGFAVGTAAFDLVPRGPSFGLPDRSVTTVSGRVVDDPRRLAGGSTLVRLELLSAEDGVGRHAGAAGKVVVFISQNAASAVAAAGKDSLVAFTGAFAEGRIGPVFRARSATVLRGPPVFRRYRNAALAAALRRFERVGWGGLAAALLLGNRDGLDDGEGELYARSGCAHVLSLSGMHLAVISALVALALKKPLGLRAAAVTSTIFVACYVIFVGFQPALVRSVIMYGLGATAILGGYPRRILPLLAAAFIVQLFLDADSARSLSFVLSYLALLGIAVLGGPVDELLSGLLPRSLRMPIAASMGAFLATAGVSAAAFGSLRPIGIAAGLVVAPAATSLMIGGLVWFVLDLCAAPLAAAVEPLVGLAATLCGRTVEIAARVRGLEADSYVPPLVASLAVGALLVYVRYRRNETRNRVDPFD